MKSKTKSKYITTLHKYARLLRKRPTLEEKELLSLLHKKSKYMFTFQTVIPPYIVDFTIRRLLIVELDGKQHNSNIEYDSRRDNYLKEWGFEILRFTNEQWNLEKEKIVDLINYTVSKYNRARLLREKKRMKRLYGLYTKTPTDEGIKMFKRTLTVEIEKNLTHIL